MTGSLTAGIHSVHFPLARSPQFDQNMLFSVKKTCLASKLAILCKLFL